MKKEPAQLAAIVLLRPVKKGWGEATLFPEVLAQAGIEIPSGFTASEKGENSQGKRFLVTTRPALVYEWLGGLGLREEPEGYFSLS